VASDEVPWCGTDGVVPSLPHDNLCKEMSSDAFAALFLVLKWVLTVLALSLPLPSGCIVPSYVLGALIGRTFANLVLRLFSAVSGEAHHALYMRVEFSFIGATAFTAAVCRSFSVVIVMFEMVGGTQVVFLQLGVASIVAIYAANLVAPSIFEASAVLKGLPQIPEPRTLFDAWEAVSTAMRWDVPQVPERFGPGTEGSRLLTKVLEKYPQAQEFAVLSGGPEAQSEPYLLGCVERATVEALVRSGQPAFNRQDICLAMQVQPSMPLKHAQQALELSGHRNLYVIEQGRLVGAVDFDGLVRAQLAQRAALHTAA